MFMPLNVIGKCVASDDELFANADAAIALGLPEVSLLPARDGGVALVGSGPSVKGQLDVIKRMQADGVPIVAIKDAHDWLIKNGVTPDFAIAIDPQAHRFNCFRLANDKVHYLIASQCNQTMFQFLHERKVTIFHLYVTKGQKRPKGKMLIGGGTTSGLRAISLFYVQGYRHFALFGFDSCLEDGVLRVNGDAPKDGDSVSEVRIEQDGETFYCTPAMALQAQHFQTYFDFIPDAVYYPYGHGLIQAILRKRSENLIDLEKTMKAPIVKNDRISFIHAMDENQASYRYRALSPCLYMHGMPCENENDRNFNPFTDDHLIVNMNDLTADTLIFAKPQAHELMDMAKAKARGAWVVADFCDDHFDWMHYSESLKIADAVTCNTAVMAQRIKELGREATVVLDGYEYPEAAPHCNGVNLLWFGHSVNRTSLYVILGDLTDYPIHMVSNFPGSIPWSKETMLKEFALADIVIIPATAKYKSNNRTLEAIRQGCFVVAEPHPSLMDIPGIWIGNIKEGIEWTRQNLTEANQRTLKAQQWLMEKYTPQILASAWKKAIQRPSTSDVVHATGTDG